MPLADKLVQLTGFGNAAGLLAMRGLFGMNQQQFQQEDTAKQVRKVTATKISVDLHTLAIPWTHPGERKRDRRG